MLQLANRRLHLLLEQDPIRVLDGDRLASRVLVVRGLAALHHLLHDVAEGGIAVAAGLSQNLRGHGTARVQATLRELVAGVRLHVRDERRLREAAIGTERSDLHFREGLLLLHLALHEQLRLRQSGEGSRVSVQCFERAASLDAIHVLLNRLYGPIPQELRIV